MNDFIEKNAANLSEEWGLTNFIVKRFDFADNYRKMLIYVTKQMYQPSSAEIEEIMVEITDPEEEKRMRREVSMLLTGRNECHHTMYTIDLDYHWDDKVMLEIEGFTKMSRVSANFDASYVVAIKLLDEKLAKKNEEQETGYEFRQLERFSLEKTKNTVVYTRDKEGNELYLDRVQGSVTCVQLIAPVMNMETSAMRLVTAETSGKLKLYRLRSGAQTLQPEFETNLYQDRVKADEDKEFKEEIKKGLIPVKIMLNHNRDLLLVLNSESEMMVYKILDDEFKLLAYTTSDEDLTQWDLSSSGQKVLLGGFPLESLQQWDLVKLTKDLISEKYEFKDFETRHIDFYMSKNKKNIAAISNCKDVEVRLEAYKFGSLDNYLARDKNKVELRKMKKKNRQKINKKVVAMEQNLGGYEEDYNKEMESGVNLSGLGVSQSNVTQEVETNQTVYDSCGDGDLD